MIQRCTAQRVAVPRSGRFASSSRQGGALEIVAEGAKLGSRSRMIQRFQLEPANELALAVFTHPAAIFARCCARRSWSSVSMLRSLR
jgi:hypothetical protein